MTTSSYMQDALPFFQPTPAHNHTETSKAAAEAAIPKVKRGQKLVLQAIQESPNGLTRDQVSSLVGIPTATVCARANELLKIGLIGPRLDETTGRKMTRPTRTGSNAEILFSMSAIAA